MKTIIRNFLSVLRRFKMATALNVAGLAVAFAAFIVILIQINFERTFDRCHKFNVFYREHFFTLLSGIRITWSHKFRKGICTLCLLQCPPYGGHLQCIRSEK